MKDQPLKFAIALMAIGLLSACATKGSNSAGMEKQNAVLVSDGKKAAAPETAPPAMPALPPQPVMSEPVAKSEPVRNSGDGLVWHQISNYDANHPTLPGAQETTQLEPLSPPSDGIHYNSSVEVYPVNDDMAPYADVPVTLPSAHYHHYAAGGEMVQQVFFPYGSSVVGKNARHQLSEMAQSLARSGSAYELDVIGHASKPVHHVSDPFKRQMINFKMAQKRARAVANTLIKAGATPDWVIATSAGDSQPNPHRHGKSQEAADRRAEVYLK